MRGVCAKAVVVLGRKREVAAAGVRAALGLLALSLPAAAQGYQDALGPGAESRAFGGAVSAGARGASATFINPAGLGLAERPEVYVGFGLSGTHRQASVDLDGEPGAEPGPPPIGSELELTPLSAFAAALPLTRWLVLGAHAAPAAFQGAAYEGDAEGTRVREARAMRLFEVGPDVAFLIPEEVLPGQLALGVGYRVTFGALHRFRSPSAGPADLHLDLTGADGSTGRLGLQYSPIPELRIGLTAQGPVGTTMSAAEGTMGGEAVSDPETEWTFPSRYTAGVRADLDRYSLALEYRFSDSSGELVYGADAGAGLPETWPGDVHSAHLGAEVRLSKADLEFPLRVGYTFESSFGSAGTLSSFDLPPAALHTVGLGGGVARRRWATNVALTGRLGGADGEALYEWSISADFLIRFDQ